jgi:hypothetical protein
VLQMEQNTNSHSPQQIALLGTEIRNCTESLLKSPYNPTLWLKRSKILIKLSFPELACGDAYKALSLIKASHDGSSKLTHCVKLEVAMDLVSAQEYFPNTLPTEILMSSIGIQRVRSQLHELEHEAVLALARGLLHAESFQECLELIRENTGKFFEAPELLSVLKAAKVAFNQRDAALLAAGKTPSEMLEYHRSGEVHVETYPWMSSEASRRSDIIHFVNDNLLKASRSQCYVKRSTIRDRVSTASGEAAAESTDVFGVFALVDIPSGRRVLKDYTCLCAVHDITGRCPACCDLLSSGTVEADCCKTRFCSAACWDNANKFHSAVCGKDLARWERATESPDYSSIAVTEDRLLLRALAFAVNFGDLHPLQAPIISRLTPFQPGSGDHEPRPFSLARSIIAPIDMLTRLGIDIYSNHNFDTWVVLTISARLDNNSRQPSDDANTDDYYIAVNPLYTFFNHSCHPNVTYEEGKNGPASTLRMKTTRNVKAGEEFFISYLLEEDLELHVSERQERLRVWFGDGCRCTRCVKEMKAEEVEGEEDVDRRE